MGPPFVFERAGRKFFHPRPPGAISTPHRPGRRGVSRGGHPAMGQARTAWALVGRVHAPVIGASAWLKRAHPSGMAKHALVTGAHPSVIRTQAFVKRAHRSCTGPRAVVSRHHSMCTRAHAFVTADNTMCTAAHLIVIVFIRIRRLANKGRSYRNRIAARRNTVAIVSIRMCRPADNGGSYRNRVVTRHNTIVIVCIQMCSLAGKEKTIADGYAGVQAEPLPQHLVRRQGQQPGPQPRRRRHGLSEAPRH